MLKNFPIISNYSVFDCLISLKSLLYSLEKAFKNTIYGVIHMILSDTEILRFI